MGNVIAIAAQLVALGLKLAPEIVIAVNAEMALSGSGEAPKPEWQEAIDAGLRTAHEALQAAQQGG